MLSYQHIYHAGSFADLVKHLVLTRTLEYLSQKDKPIFYLETHGGRGLYPLNSAEALKTKEAELGIKRIWQNPAPEPCQRFLQIIHGLNPDGELKVYPGSPQIAIDLLRAQDRLYIHELHPQEFQHLKTLGKQQKRVFYANEDGIKNLPALLPPPEKRVLVFIDPSYELKQEYQSIPKAIKAAYEKCPNAIFILWYPIIDQDRYKTLMHGLHKIPSLKNLKLEFDLDPKTQEGMHGCGLWLINPPYTLEQEAPLFLDFLKDMLGSKQSKISIETPIFEPKHQPRKL